MIQSRTTVSFIIGITAFFATALFSLTAFGFGGGDHDFDIDEPTCYGEIGDDACNHPHGICEAEDECHCYEGWSGEECTVTECFGISTEDEDEDEDDCNGDGESEDEDDCNGDGESEDEEAICNGHGECVDYNVCECDPDWYGDECETATCFGVPGDSTVPPVCSGNGECIDHDNCKCNGEYTGPAINNQCQEPICFGIRSGSISTCSRNGVCVLPDTCECSDGWTGEECEIPVCYDVDGDDDDVCSGNGYCAGPDNCHCDGDWSGDECEISTCFGISSDEEMVCSGNGSCQDFDTCECDDGWIGEDCDVAVCFGTEADAADVCSGQGSCSAPDACDCDEGWSGEECDTPVCFGFDADHDAVCYGQGSCSAPDTCECDEGWSGEECGIPVCFGTEADAADVCSGQGTCSAPDACDCDEGWSGEECDIPVCFGTEADSADVCSGQGSCSAPDACECDEGWSGAECDIPVCFDTDADDADVCSGRGSCSATDACDCDDGWSGEECGVPVCFGTEADAADVCSGQGSCSAPDACECDEGWSGEECDIPVCFGTEADDADVCSGQGSCSAPDVCECDDNSSGENCDVAVCFGTEADAADVCSGRGSCSATDACDCDEDWSGEKCDIPICFGTEADAADVCSGQGSCSAPDACECDDGWTGEECEIPVCFDTDADDSDVCSGQGTCSAPDACECDDGWSGEQCQCDEGWSGEDCDIPVCYGTGADDGGVCSGQGTCTDPDVCDCDSGWTGTQCNTAVCFGTDGNDSGVCSGRGSCTAPDSCNCNHGWTGTQCTTPVCYGTNANANSVCSGQGTCSAPNSCNCDDGWSGSECGDPLAWQIEWASEPVDALQVAGEAISPAPAIQIVDVEGEPVDEAVTLEATLSGEGDLLGTTSVVADDAMAVFDDLIIEDAGADYVLHFSTDELGDVSSNTFEVHAADVDELLWISGDINDATTDDVLTPPVEVELYDRFGNRAYHADEDVRVRLNDDDVALDGTTTVAAEEGLVVFDELGISTVGDGYVLVVETDHLESIESNPFDIEAGTANQLELVEQPETGAVATELTPAFVVELRDANNNLVDDATGTIEVEVDSGPGNLDGTTSVQTVDGVALFDTLSLDMVGSHILRFVAADDEDLPEVTSEPIEVNAGAPTQLVVSEQPGNGLGGEALSVQPVVEIYDDGDNLVDHLEEFSVHAYLREDTGADDAQIIDGDTATGSGGTASFESLTIDRAATDYELVIEVDDGAAEGLTVITDAFDIDVGPAAKMELAVQPGGADGGEVFIDQPILEVQDLGGNVVEDADTHVSVELTGGDEAAMLAGDDADHGVSAVEGVVTFEDLSIDAPAPDYVLVFADTAGALPDVQSEPFGVASAPAQLRVTEQPSLTGQDRAIDPPLVIEVQDVMGTRVAGDNETVVIAQIQGAGSLSGGDAEGVQAEEGRVIFEDLRVDTPQLGATLRFVADDLSDDTSEPFDVVGDGVALELVSETMPLNQHQESTVNMIVDADAPMVLMIVDANELPVFFDDTTEVSASLKSESGDPDATLTGTLTVTAEEGVVVFDDLSIDLPGDDYILEFSAPELIGVQTQPFAIDGDQPVDDDFADDDLSEEGQQGEESGTAEGCSSSCMIMRSPGDMTWLFIVFATLVIIAAGRRRSANV